MTVSLISNDLLDEFKELLDSTSNEINIISPFIGLQTSKLLADWLSSNPNVKCNLITRFYREEFIEKVSSVYGLEILLQAGVNIYALIGLHSKVYIFDEHSSIIGSANFTHGGFVSNHEISVYLSNEYEITQKCQEYFDELVELIVATGEGIVTQEWIDAEKEAIRKTAQNRKDKTTTYSNEYKKGAKLPKIKRQDLFETLLQNDEVDQVQEGIWLKFEGTGEERIPNDLNYKEMKGSKLRDLNQTFFPTNPSGIQKDEILFLTIVSYDELNNPTPIIVGYAHTYGFNKKNKADISDINNEPWKERFPFFVEFSNGKVINAPIKHGIRLVDLYDGIGKSTYPSLKKKDYVTQKSLHSMHFRRSHIRITKEAHDYLMKELDKRFSQYGFIKLGL